MWKSGWQEEEVFLPLFLMLFLFLLFLMVLIFLFLFLFPLPLLLQPGFPNTSSPTATFYTQTFRNILYKINVLGKYSSIFSPSIPLS